MQVLQLHFAYNVLLVATPLALDRLQPVPNVHQAATPQVLGLPTAQLARLGATPLPLGLFSTAPSVLLAAISQALEHKQLLPVYHVQQAATSLAPA